MEVVEVLPFLEAHVEQPRSSRVRWAAHNVRFHRTGGKRFHDLVVGDLTLAYEALVLPGDPGQTIFAYTAEPNFPSQDALNLPASWTWAPDRVCAVQTNEGT